MRFAQRQLEEGTAAGLGCDELLEPAAGGGGGGEAQEVAVAVAVVGDQVGADLSDRREPALEVVAPK